MRMMTRSGWLAGVLIGALVDMAAGAPHPVGSVNAFLGNSARSELIGPEMWTATIQGVPAPAPDGPEDLLINGQLPYYAWSPPSLGFSGQWHICHGTPLHDPVRLDVARIDGDETTKLTFTPTRNWWTPAGMTTYYRARPSGRPDEYPDAGYLAVKERKCITADNVFVAEVELVHDFRTPQEYRVALHGTFADSTIEAGASRVGPGDSLAALSDGKEPADSGDLSVARFTWWDHRGTEEWVEYRFAEPRRVAEIAVYWFDDEGRGSCRTPRSWRLLYEADGQWFGVRDAEDFGTDRDKFNRVRFEPVTTKGLRIVAQLQPGMSAGILEWRVTPESEPASESPVRVGSIHTQARAGGLGKLGPIPVDLHAALVTTRGSLNDRVTLGPYGRTRFRYALALDADDPQKALAKARSAMDREDVFEANARAFDDWFERNVPVLETADGDLLKMYYYRWYVVWRAHHDVRRLLPNHYYPRPVFYESPTGGWYGCVIGLPVPCQISEARWLRDPQPGWDHIRNWADGIQGYRGYIQFTPMTIWQFYKSHPDREALADSFASIRDFSLAALVDGDPRKLTRTAGSWVTGAEYQPNFYQFTDPPWDFRNDSEFARSDSRFKLTTLIRLDTTSHAIANLRASARMADLLGRQEGPELARKAELMGATLKAKLWDPKTGMFYAADPESGALADLAPCYDSFAPFMWGTVTEPVYLKALDKFVDPDWFWSEFPLRTVSRTCPMYFSGNALTGPTAASPGEPHHYGCSWNGPSWHYSNSLMAEALGSAVAHGRSDLKGKWLTFMERWTEMHFLYGDRSVPCAREHHRPTDGARLRATNDYFHSAWLDPFIRYWAGVRIGDDLEHVVFDPFTDASFCLAGVPVLGRELTFEQGCDEQGRPVRTVRDATGAVLAQEKGNAPLSLALPAP